MRNSSEAGKRDDERGVIQICTILGGTWGYGGILLTISSSMGVRVPNETTWKEVENKEKEVVLSATYS